jgi:hypothetical protein
MMETRMYHLGSQEQEQVRAILAKGMTTSPKVWKEHHTR